MATQPDVLWSETQEQLSAFPDFVPCQVWTEEAVRLAGRVRRLRQLQVEAGPRPLARSPRSRS